MNATAALEVAGLSFAFGGLQVAQAISFDLPAGSRAALIGPNGAGKTTLVDLVAGGLRPHAGTVRLAGRDVTREPTRARARAGLVRSFQISRLFGDLSARQHLQLARLRRSHHGAAMLASVPRALGADTHVDEALAHFDLHAIADKPVRVLAYGQQRLVELAMTLALEPRVLLLDEPAAGVPSDEVRHLMQAIDALPASLAVLLVEHDMELVFRFASRVLVLAGGRLIADGTPAAVAALPAVRTAYLGSLGVGHAA